MEERLHHILMPKILFSQRDWISLLSSGAHQCMLTLAACRIIHLHDLRLDRQEYAAGRTCSLQARH